MAEITSIYLQSDLKANAKVYCVRKGITLSGLIHTLLSREIENGEEIQDSIEDRKKQIEDIDAEIEALTQKAEEKSSSPKPCNICNQFKDDYSADNSIGKICRTCFLASGNKHDDQLKYAILMGNV